MFIGIKNSLPSMSVITTVRALTRPVTLVPVFIIAAMFGIVGAHAVGQAPDWPRILLAGGLLVVANGASNMINELGDQVEDSASPTKSARPVVSGAVDPMVILSVVIVSWLLALMAAVLFLPRIFTLIYASIVIFALLYSYPPRLKKRFPANYIGIATPRGGLGIAAAFVVQGTFFSPVLWTVMAITVPFVLFANETRNIDDRMADLYADVRTVSVIWGEKAGRWFSLVGFVIPPVLAIAFGLYRRFPWVLLLIPFTAFIAYNIFRWKGTKLWVAYYGYFAFLAVILALTFTA